MNKAKKNSLLTFFVTLLMVAICSFATVTVLAEENAAEVPQTVTIEQARASEAENVAGKDTLKVSDNIHEGNNYGITYEKGVFTATGNGNWRRAAMELSNKYLSSGVAVKDRKQVATSTVTTYVTANFNYSACVENMNAGILFGKRAVGENTRYYGLVISPTQKVVFVYTFDLSKDGVFLSNAQGPVSYDPIVYEAGTDYKIEILMKPTGLDVYVGGNEIATDFTTVNETNESVVGLTPTLGLSWCDISVTLSNLSLKYIDATAALKSVSIEEARASEAENVASKAALTVSDNIREGNNYGITYENYAFTATGNGGWRRSAMELSNKYLASGVAKKDGEIVNTNEITTYVTGVFNYSSCAENMNAGILFGKRAVGENTRYYGLVISPTQKVVFVYTFDLSKDGVFLSNAQGPVSYDPIVYEAGTDYKIEILMKPNGLDIFVGGNEIATDFTTVNETNESVVGLTPTLGLSWCDISVTLSNLSLKYIDATVAVKGVTIEDARASAAENVVDKAAVKVSDNFREGDNYGITYANGVFTATATGAWSRSAMELRNKYLSSGVATKDDQEVATSIVNTYITGTFNYSSCEDSRSAGILFGKRTIEGGTRYYGLVISPTQKVVFVYTFDVDEGGKVLSEKQGPVSYDPIVYEAGTDYKIEILMKPNGLDIFVGGNEIATDFTTVNETNESVVGLTPTLGLSWCDITVTLSDLSMKFIDATAKVAVVNYTLEQARDSQAANIVNKDTLTASNNFREGDNYGITFANGVFTTTATGNWSRAAMKLKNRYLNSTTVIMDEEKVSSANAAAYISATLTFTSADEYKNIGTLIGMRENENTYTYYAVVISFSQKIVFIYTFDTDMAGNYVNESEKQGPVSYDTIDVVYNEAYKLEVVLNPEIGVTIAWGGNVVCENLETVYESEKPLTGLCPVVGLSWADMSGTAENFVLKYLNAEVVPEKAKDDQGPIEEPTYPEKPARPEINTEIIIPEINRPADSENGGCESSIHMQLFAAIPLFAAAVISLRKRRQ